MKTKLFLSYSRKDRTQIEELKNKLEGDDGLQVFRDVDDIMPSEEWQPRIENLIRKSDVILFALSPHSLLSEVCEWELKLAESLNKKIIPVVVKEVEGNVPPAISKLNYIFCTNDSEIESGQRLIGDAINVDIDWVREHTRLGEQALRWSNAASNGSLLLRGIELEEAETWLSSRPRDAPSPTETQLEYVTASRRAASRRQQWWITGSLAVAIMAVGLSIWSEINRREAVTQRTRIENILERTTKATKELVVNVADKYVAKRGIPRAIIMDILQQAKSLVEGLQEIGESRPELLRNGGLAMAELSDALRSQGEFDLALKSAQSTTKIFKQLTQLDSNNAAWLSGVALGHDRMGDIYMDLGQPKVAKENYDEMRRVVTSLPSSPGKESLVAIASENIGDILILEEQYDDALIEFEYALARRQELQQSDANEGEELEREIAVSFEKIGDTQMALGNNESALEAYSESLRLTKRISERDPSNTNWLRDLSVANHKIGNAMMQTDQAEQALDHFEADFSISQSLHQSDPNWNDWRYSVVVSSERLGNVNYLLKNFAKAEEAFETSITHSRILLEQQSATPKLVENISKLLQSLTLIKEKTDSWEAAVAKAEEAVTFLQKIDGTQSLQTNHHNNAAWFALLNGDFSRALEHSKVATSFDQENLVLQPNLAHALLFLGRKEEAKGIYLKHIGKTVRGSTKWLDLIYSDLDAFQSANIQIEEVSLIRQMLNEYGQ
ncbi:MAG: TIR domain-containing protein [Rhizobiaceae bacterium]